MQIIGTEIQDFIHSGRVIDRSGRGCLSNELIKFVLSNYPADFIALPERWLPDIPNHEGDDKVYDELEHLQGDDFKVEYRNRCIKYFSDRGDVIRVSPFIWKYATPNIFIEDMTPFINAEEVLWVKFSENVKEEALNFYSNAKSFEFEQNHFDLTIENLVAKTEYMYTTAIDWTGIIFMSNKLETLDKFRQDAISNGYDADWRFEKNQ